MRSTVKKTSAAAALAAAAGVTALVAAPSAALSPASAFANCTEANSAGYSNITSDSPYYGAHLDDDMDGVGCEDGTWAGGTTTQPAEELPIAQDWTTIEGEGWSPVWGEGESGEHVIIDWVSPEMEEAVGGGGGQQVSQMPVGGADTGVAQKATGNVVPALALGGGMALAAAAGAVYVVRRGVTS
jgi:hypothetical protein